MSQSQIQAAKDLGYEVEVAMEMPGDLPDVYRVEGPGLSLLINENDDDTWERIINPAVFQSHERQATTPDMPADVKLQLTWDTAVAVGDATKKEADAAITSWEEEQAASA